MDISVGIITYRRPECVERLLNSLQEQTRQPDEIIIVDDSPDEETAEVVRGFNKESNVSTEYIHNVEKSIQGEARNKVIQSANGDVICFLDDDTYAVESWLEAIEATYEENPEAVAVGGPALDTDEELNLEVELDKSPENQNKFNMYGEVKDNSNCWVPSETVETHKYRGANMSFKKEVLKEVGGFDSNYKGNGFREDDDVMAQIWKKGEKMLYAPEAQVYHLRTEEGGSRADDNLAYWQGRNLIYFVKKNFPENFNMAIFRLILHTDGQPPPIWKDVVGMFVYQDFSRIQKFRGYIAELIRLP